jgi:fido (protein-threonine AMPylation protein)
MSLQGTVTQHDFPDRRFLFQDVFDWADEPRTVSLAKQDFEGPEGAAAWYAVAAVIEADADQGVNSLCFKIE